MEVKEWLGNDNKLGIDIWERKYRFDNESFDEWLERVSGGNEDLKQTIKDKKFLFGGRTLSNRGTGKKGSFSNCYSRGFVEDDLDDIMQANTDIARTFKAQGGQGISLSKLRPRGCGINHNQFKSDGIIPFMEIYNRTTESISQGGSRKGALIMSLDIWHKEAPEFITIKSETGRIQKANLSLEIDDEFMRCVREYYKTGEEINKTIKRNYGSGNTIEYEVCPIKLYKKMMETAYDWAEPGCIFTNRFRNYNMMQYCDDYQIETCNPCGEQPLPKHSACVSGDTLVVLPDRVTTIEKLMESKEDYYILSNDNKFRRFNSVADKGVKPVYELTLDNGLSIKATADHRFETASGLKELQDIVAGEDEVKVKRGFNMSAYGDNDELYEMFGWLHGDGWLTNGAVGISFNNKDGDFPAKDRLLPIFKDCFDCENIKPLKDDEVSYQLQVTHNDATIEKCKKLGFVFGHASERVLPTTFYDWTLIQQLSFIRGLFEADGNVQGKSLSQEFLYSSSEKLVKQVQKFLASIGIHSSFYKTVFYGETTRNRNPQYKIGVSKESANLFMKLVGFNGHKKGDRFMPSRYKDEDYYTVKSIEYVGEENVYDVMEVNKTNMFFANGMSVHNCNLASINLSAFIKKPFTKNAYFDTEDFVKTVRIGIEGLDTVLDENLDNHALPEQKVMAKNYRNVGLGIMGLHDALIKMGITYGSKKSIEFADSIMALMFRSAVIASSELAKEKGSFPKYSNDLLKSEIITNHFTQNEIDSLGLAETGLRNCSLLSIAPTGSLGTMLNISTGCEPLFALSYTRKTESLNGGEDKYYKVYTGVVNEYIEHGGDANNLPNCFNCSADLKWHDRIDMQSVLQNHTDTAISSTINLPHEIPIEEIEQLYLYAWEKGLKGVTIFRDDCKRVGILTTKSNNDEANKSDTHGADSEDVKFDSIVPVSRKTLGTTSGQTFCKKSSCGTLYITINRDADGNIVESFVNASKGGICQSNVNAVNRLLSLCLRSGTKVDEVIDQLKGITCPACVKTLGKGKYLDGISCPDIIAKTLKEFRDSGNNIHVKNEQSKAEPVKSVPTATKTSELNKPTSIERCPDCGEPLHHDGGCVICENCGWSKCG